MARKPKLTPTQVADALRQANGLQAAAARSLGVSRTTISNYIEKYDEVSKAYDEANETTIDKVESKLLENVNAGNVIAQIFYLKTKGKHRGYVETMKHEGGGPDSPPIKIKVEYASPD